MASSSKKSRLDNNGNRNLKKKVNRNKVKLILEVQKARLFAGSSSLEFRLNKKRVRVISNSQNVPEYSQGIVYWCSRDCRVQDNWAALNAQKLALKNEFPLHFCYCLVNSVDTTYRHFILKGLEEVSNELTQLDITFHLLEGTAGEVLPQFGNKYKIGAVVCDFTPLREPLNWLKDVKNKLPKDVPLIQVDAHNIVPCWITSDKVEYSIYTIRNRINSKLNEYLTEYPPLIIHPYKSIHKP